MPGGDGASGFLWHLLRRLAAAAGAVGLTLAIFLILPMLQAIGGPAARDLMVREVEVAEPPPPPPPVEEALREEEPPPQEPPQLAEQAPPLDLAQLELALNPALGESATGDFAVKLITQMTQGGDGGEAGVDRIFSLAELDQRPRVIFQTPPSYPPELRRGRRQGSVHVVFLVDRQGKVVSPRVERSSDPAFEKVALEAVRQWRFEPGTRKGEKVQFKMRVPISFNAG